ncbi:MAG: glycoside hydrolase family 3 protein [Ruminococcus sp.]|nr:glycoside hydrolase family 3 protein [Ruminococcus sp.]
MAERILDWNEYINKAAEVCAEGSVLLRNENSALPLSRDKSVAVFGRIQLNYYKSGTGSGGMVNVSKVWNVVDGLRELGARIDEEVYETYLRWTDDNPYELGEKWGGEPWSQEEMPLSDEFVSAAAARSDTALVIIGRTAGEEKDNNAGEGSFKLSKGERDMLAAVRKRFEKVAVLLNTGNTIDMSFVDEFSPDAVMYIWQGGMIGGLGAAKALLGDIAPSGRLPDTVALDLTDHPSDKYFYGKERNIYAEDIFVGYRYFETFAKDRVRYPFGSGLTYTAFEVCASGSADVSGRKVTVTAEVKNTGSFSGKNAVLVYCSAPQGRLGKPARVLCGFEKTRTLAPGESETLSIELPFESFASYDDSGASGHAYAWVLEQGCYCFYAGGDVRTAEEVFSFELGEDMVIEQLKQALAPVTPFERMVGGGAEPRFEAVPLLKTDPAVEKLAALPGEIKPAGGDRKLAAVVSGEISLDEFISQLSDDDLCVLVRGEGMCSPKVTPGTAAAFGGVSDRLAELGVPCGCCSDGPSGMRLDCGTKAFSLPNGTLIASTFDKKLVQELFACTGLEMTANKVDCLLGPGMNIHRHPLNGRNFEYFSEDPFLTGTIAAAELKGLHSAGVEGTVKHFCGNNQETNRHNIDSIVSERALREIYLRGFEIAVKDGRARSVMTTYGQVNGLWTAGNFELDTEILRNEWGFDGFVMTDWWANINRSRGERPDKSALASMVAAQNDIYMVCADSVKHPDDLEAALADGRLTRGELQRSAKNILGFLMTTHAMERIMGTGDTVKVINKPDEGTSDDAGSEVFLLNGSAVVDLSGVRTGRNAEYSFTFDVQKTGFHKFTLTASSTASETAQMNVTIYSLGTPFGTFTYNGTNGEPVSFTTGEVPLFSRYSIIRLHFSLGGLDLISLKAENTKPF